MIKKSFATFMIALTYILTTQAQNKLSVDKVYSTYMRNSGTIIENKKIKGYFFLYISDKIDKRTDEYTLQILDENLNKVRDIKFQDTKKLNLLEASYNASSLAFLFKNEEDKTLDMKVYDIDGTLKYTYSREYDKKTDELMDRYQTMHTDEGTNQNVYDLGEVGYASVLPLRDGTQRTYEVDYYSSREKKQWAYTPDDDEEHYASAEFLGSTDSLVILEVTKKNRALSGKTTAHLVGINFITQKKAFDIDDVNDTYTFVSSGVESMNGTGKIMVFGSYFDKSDNIIKDASKGLAVYIIDSKGKMLLKTYNSWENDFSKYLSTNSKGKIDNVGFLYIHKVIQMPDGKIFAVGEGYKRQISVGGTALKVFGALAGVRSSAVGATKIVTTDMVIMEFNNKYKITNATIYDKTNNTVIASAMSDQNSQHALGIYLKMTGAFDYEFTTGDIENNNFTVCYSDFVRDADYKGQTFNSIRYNGSKFSQDKIELKSKGSSLKVFPAKAGSIMIMEYFKKEKRLDFRLEKLG